MSWPASIPKPAGRSSPLEKPADTLSLGPVSRLIETHHARNPRLLAFHGALAAVLIVKGCGLTLALGAGIGLAIAATVLACGGWMVYRLIQGFAGDEAPPVSGDRFALRGSNKCVPQ